MPGLGVKLGLLRASAGSSRRFWARKGQQLVLEGQSAALGVSLGTSV